MDTRNKITVQIGDVVRLDSWGHCVLEVMDIGKFTLIGCLIEVKTGEIVVPLFMAPIEGDWIKSLTVSDILK